MAPRTVEWNVAPPAGYSYPFPYSRYEVPGLANYTAYPYSAIGKVFVTFESGLEGSCSGAAVVSANESVVFTAGHCVHSLAHGWITDFVFVPGYRDGTSPFGSWVAIEAWAKNKWLDAEDPRVDFAAVVVDTSPAGATLTDTVGDLGLAWNAGRINHWQSFGYPATAPFSGSRQYLCSASFAVSDPAWKRRTTVGIGCDMKQGSSGGPWILDFGGGYYLNGLNSYGRPALGWDDSMFSPYFRGGVRSLHGCAEDGVC